MDTEFLDISTSYRLQFGFGIGHILNDVCASLWFTYFLVYFHLVLEFTATQSGNLMLVGQVVDALATPFVGYHSDHTNNFISARYGKRKIWHLFGTVCVLASFPFIFTSCIGCSTTHKWAQMYYFAAFIVIFQIGWASVQISHLSLIPELSEDLHTRKHLTAVRYVLTVFSTLLVYILAWVYLGFSVEAGTQQVGPSDSWKFSYLAYTVLVLGTIASLVFHITVTEKSSNLRQEQLTEGGSTAHCDILRTPAMYQIACIYMSTRLVVNISQVLIPLYLHRTLLLGTRSLALVPFTMYTGSLAAAWVQRFAPRSMTRKYSYVVGAACALGGFIWIYLGSFMAHMDVFIYLIAVLIGFGGAVMLVTSLALTADLVGEKTEASAFVYGLMSFTDKLACGVAIAVIQMFAECAEKTYYRDALGWVCGTASVVGLVCTLLLPKITTDALQDQNTLINNQTLEEETMAPDDV